MKALKFLSLVLSQWMLLQGGYSMNATKSASLATTKPQILTISTTTFGGPTTVGIAENVTQSIHPVNETSAQNASLGEPSPDKNHTIVAIFHNVTYHNLNSSILNCTKATSGNFTFGERISNETLKTNYSTVAEAIASPESPAPKFRLQKSAAVAAGVFLVSAVIGYLSCVGYRRYLQRKYGDSQMVSREDVYDTSDLRYFEI